MKKAVLLLSLSASDLFAMGGEDNVLPAKHPAPAAYVAPAQTDFDADVYTQEYRDHAAEIKRMMDEENLGESIVYNVFLFCHQNNIYPFAVGAHSISLKNPTRTSP